jgi:hypothetical protein
MPRELKWHGFEFGQGRPPSMTNAQIRAALGHCNLQTPVWGNNGSSTGPLMGRHGGPMTVGDLLQDGAPPEGAMSLTAEQVEVVRVELRPEGVVLVADPRRSHLRQ